MEVSQLPPSQVGLPGIGIHIRLHLFSSDRGCLLDLGTCIELGDRCAIPHWTLWPPRERGLWRVLTLLEPTPWLQSAPLLALCERWLTRCRLGEIASLVRSSTTSPFCESLSVLATVLQVLIVSCESGKANLVNTIAR